MTAFEARILKSASRDLERLDNPIARRIVERIRWLSQNVESIKSEALKGDLAGLFKLREGGLSDNLRNRSGRRSDYYSRHWSPESDLQEEIVGK